MRAVTHQFRRSSAPTSGARLACADSTGSAASGPAPPSSRPLPTCPPRLRLAPRAGPRPPRRPRASPGSRLATATSSGAPDATVARRRRSPSFKVIAAVGRNRAGQGATIEPLTEWLLAASPTKNQAAYEHFLGLRTTRSVAPSPPRCRAGTPRRPSTPGRVAPWPLAARPTARCARGGRGRRGEGRKSSPRAQPGVRLTGDRHRIAAAGHRRGRVLRHRHRRGRGRSPRSALRGCALPVRARGRPRRARRTGRGRGRADGAGTADARPGVRPPGRPARPRAGRTAVVQKEVEGRRDGSASALTAGAAAQMVQLRNATQANVRRTAETARKPAPASPRTLWAATCARPPRRRRRWARATARPWRPPAPVP